MAEPSIWTAQFDAELTRLWADHRLAAKAIGEILGVNKNQVIGRAHRLKLPMRRPVGASKSTKRKSDRRVDSFNPSRMRRPRIVPVHVAKPRPIPVEVPMPESLHLTIMELTNSTCKYPDDGERAVTFCGNPTEAGASWCPAHYRICYVTPDRRPRSERFVVKRNFDLPEVVA